MRKKVIVQLLSENTVIRPLLSIYGNLYFLIGLDYSNVTSQVKIY